MAKSRLPLAERAALLALTGQKTLNQVVLDSPDLLEAGSGDGGAGSGVEVRLIRLLRRRIRLCRN